MNITRIGRRDHSGRAGQARWPSISGITIIGQQQNRNLPALEQRQRRRAAIDRPSTSYPTPIERARVRYFAHRIVVFGQQDADHSILVMVVRTPPSRHTIYAASP